MYGTEERYEHRSWGWRRSVGAAAVIAVATLLVAPILNHVFGAGTLLGTSLYTLAGGGLEILAGGLLSGTLINTRSLNDPVAPIEPIGWDGESIGFKSLALVVFLAGVISLVCGFALLVIAVNT